jgi:hypothetical protein
MNAHQIQLLSDHVYATPGSEPIEPVEPLLKAVREMARRDWAVRVLDAWGELHDERAPAPQRQAPESYTLSVYGRVCWGPTPDAGRLAAAEAVFAELPEDVRRELGAQP